MAPKLQAKMNEPEVAKDLGSSPPGVNLIPSDLAWAPTFSIGNRGRILIWLTVLFALSVIGSTGGRLYYEHQFDQAAAALAQETARLDQEMASHQASESAWSALRDRLLVLSSLLEQHQSALPALAVLEQTVLPMVQYTTLSLSSGTVSVNGVTLTYQDLATQLTALRQDSRVSGATITAMDFSADKNILTFGLSITLRPEALTYAPSTR